MLKSIELEHAFKNLFCGVELHPFAEALLKKMNWENLLQAKEHYAVPVYAYATCTEESSGCEYRGDLLFPLPATMIFSMTYLVSNTGDGIIFERRVELWLTDDMKFVVVSNAHTDFYDGEFVSEYRTIKTRDQDLFPQVIELDYNLLVLLLAAMADEYANSDMPTYEL